MPENPQQERIARALAPFVPASSLEEVSRWIDQHKIQLTITRHRHSVLGDYRRPDRQRGHRISVNGSLNRYAFLITLVHEMAHLTTWLKHGDRVNPHGVEWKAEFRLLMHQFLLTAVFPPELNRALRQYMDDPAASSCTDETLMRVLRSYDSRPAGVLVSDLEDQEMFLFRNSRLFRRESRIRKRIRCTEVKTGRIYLFSPVAEVKRWTPEAKTS